MCGCVCFNSLVNEHILFPIARFGEISKPSLLQTDKCILQKFPNRAIFHEFFDKLSGICQEKRTIIQRKIGAIYISMEHGAICQAANWQCTIFFPFQRKRVSRQRLKFQLFYFSTQQVSFLFSIAILFICQKNNIIPIQGRFRSPKKIVIQGSAKL